MEESQTTQVGRLLVHAASNVLARLQLPQEPPTPEFQYVPPQSQFQRFQDAILGLIPWLQRIFYLLFVGTILLITSIISYGTLYFLVMPSTHASEYLYFDYTCASSFPFAQPQILPCTKPPTCIPTASVDLSQKHAPWDAYNPNVTCTPIYERGVLVPRQAYALEVVLHLPESDTNRDVGMFGVQVELQTKDRIALASSIRSTRLPHESLWVGVIRKMIWIVPLVLGTMTERRVIVVPSYRNYVETADAPLRHIVVRLLSRGPTWPSGSPIEVIHGEVRIGKELNVVQETLKEWFYTCAVLGVSLLFALQALIWTAVHVWVDWRRKSRDALLNNENPHDFFDASLHEHYNFVPDGDDDDDDDDQWDEMSTQQDEVRTPTLSSEQLVDEYVEDAPILEDVSTLGQSNQEELNDAESL